MFKEDWSDANIIFTNCLLFNEQLTENLAEQFKELKKGTRILSSKDLPVKDFL